MRILYDGYVYRELFAGESTVLSNLIKRPPSHFVPLLTTCQDHIFDPPAHTNLQGFTFKLVRPLRIFAGGSITFAMWNLAPLLLVRRCASLARRGREIADTTSSQWN
jgi:hypothetical protein